MATDPKKSLPSSAASSIGKTDVDRLALIPAAVGVSLVSFDRCKTCGASSLSPHRIPKSINNYRCEDKHQGLDELSSG